MNEGSFQPVVYKEAGWLFLRAACPFTDRSVF